MDDVSELFDVATRRIALVTVFVELNIRPYTELRSGANSPSEGPNWQDF